VAILPIVVVPDEALKKKAEDITNIDDRIRSLAKDMADTMYHAPGIGLAANQVGKLVKLIVFDIVYPYAEPHEKKKNPICILNPRITAAEGSCSKEEGCLSVPEFGLEVRRAERVQVVGIDLDGNPIKMDAEGLLARVLQHEIDHLNGATILDHASPLKRNLYKRRLKKKQRKDE
jgi:peptide deformylase